MWTADHPEVAQHWIVDRLPMTTVGNAVVYSECEHQVTRFPQPVANVLGDRAHRLLRKAKTGLNCKPVSVLALVSEVI